MKNIALICQPEMHLLTFINKYDTVFINIMTNVGHYENLPNASQLRARVFIDVLPQNSIIEAARTGSVTAVIPAEFPYPGADDTAGFACFLKETPSSLVEYRSFDIAPDVVPLGFVLNELIGKRSSNDGDSSDLPGAPLPEFMHLIFGNFAKELGRLATERRVVPVDLRYDQLLVDKEESSLVILPPVLMRSATFIPVDLRRVADNLSASLFGPHMTSDERELSPKVATMLQSAFRDSQEQ